MFVHFVVPVVVVGVVYLSSRRHVLHWSLWLFVESLSPSLLFYSPLLPFFALLNKGNFFVLVFTFPAPSCFFSTDL